ncbi:hypothetical protein AB0H88_28860 [Nonomuraea sp. NPDC050680]|uniref:hypothetical protein n=1 Tax=Nonomuraea sp. NPDC050680 TaxID=3154630 RepID=UPI0033EBD063
MTFIRALRCCMASAAAFTVLILLTTQFRAVRAYSPWQDDPYDAVISATELLVPALALALAIRAWVRPGSAELLRGARVVLTAVAATAVTCWASVAVGAHADMRGWRQLLLIAGLAVVTLSAVPLALALRHAGPAARGHTDWVEDFLAAVQRLGIPVAWACRVAEALRRHRIIAAILLATAVSGSLASAEAIGDGLGPQPVQAAAFRVVVGVTLLIALLVPLNAYLGLLGRAQGSTEPRRRPPVVRAALYGAAASVPVTIAFRDGIGYLLDYCRLPGADQSAGRGAGGHRRPGHAAGADLQDPQAAPLPDPDRAAARARRAGRRISGRGDRAEGTAAGPARPDRRVRGRAPDPGMDRHQPDGPPRAAARPAT